MNPVDFRSTARDIAKMLDAQGITYDVYQLLNLADALIAKGYVAEADYSTHAGRVTAACESPTVMQHMYDGKKINAIKELRLLTNCGLKEAKDAVEDNLVAIKVNLMSNPWDHHNYEPPF